jgi:formate dehydrogenase major subunit/formate dehydrogenase alpha subunit
MEQAWGVSSLPDKPGLKATEMIPKAMDKDIRGMYIIGENPALSDPDSEHAKRSLRNLDFLVVQDIFLNETAREADVVLPGCAFAEKDGTFTNTERRVQRVRKALQQPGLARQDWDIICDLSGRMGYSMSYPDSEAIMRELAGITPSYGGITYERIDREGIHWPCTDAGHPGTPILHCEQFACGLGQLHPIDFVPPAEMPDEEYPLILTTGRVLYQYHTGTMTRKSGGLNALAPYCFVEISPEDAERFNLEDEAEVHVTSRRGSVRCRASISRRAVPGTVFMPFHYAEASANVLTNTASDPVSGIPELKVCAVNLARAGETLSSREGES